MHIYRVAFASVLALVLATGCVIRPNEVLSNKQMVDLLVDLHAAEGIIQAAAMTYGHDEEVNNYYAMVLEKHGVTQAEFDSSLVWYTANPAYFQSVYPKVMKRLQARLDTETARLELMQKGLDARKEKLQIGFSEEFLLPDVMSYVDSIFAQAERQLAMDTAWEPPLPHF